MLLMVVLQLLVKLVQLVLQHAHGPHQTPSLLVALLVLQLQTMLPMVVLQLLVKLAQLVLQHAHGPHQTPSLLIA